MTALGRWLRAIPTLLRVGVAETVAYRAEFLIWMLTTTLPLSMLGLWTSVAREAPFAQFGTREFVAYYLGALIVRNLTGSWVVWQINDELRRGVLSIRLLRPIHPFITYSMSHLAAVPLRSLIAVPFALVLLTSTGRDLLVTDPGRLAVLAASLAGAWLLTFFMLVLIGALGLHIDKSIAVFDVYLGLFSVLSGYLVPLDLLPDWAGRAAHYAPFRYMLGFPVELLIGFYPSATSALPDLAMQWGYVAIVIGAALVVWESGIKRYEAFGA